MSASKLFDRPRDVLPAAGTARSWNAPRNRWAQPMQHRPGPQGESQQIRLVRAGQLVGFSDICGQPGPSPRRMTTTPSKSLPARFASISAAPSLASRRTLSLSARASRNTASFLASFRLGGTSGRQRRSNSATPSSVSLAMVSSTVATRVARRRSSDRARICWAVQPSTFAGQFAQPFGMDCFSAGMIQAGSAKGGKLIERRTPAHDVPARPAEAEPTPAHSSTCPLLAEAAHREPRFAGRDRASSRSDPRHNAQPRPIPAATQHSITDRPQRQ